MSKKIKRGAIGCSVAAVAIFAMCVVTLTASSGGRRALPWSATDIHEYYDGPVSDFMVCLRARIKESDFDSYANRLGLDQVYVESEHKSLLVSWMPCQEVWWTPPKSLDGARFQYQEGETYFAMAKYEAGFVYFVAFAW